MKSLVETVMSTVLWLESRLGGPQLWRGVDWAVLSACVMSSTAAAFLGVIGLWCGRRFYLMTAMGFSCCVSFWYRIYLLSATLSNRYSTTFASPLVHILLISSGLATTIFYTCMAMTCLHTFIAITLHPSQYNPIRASQTYVCTAFIMGVLGAVFKWSMASIIASNYERACAAAKSQDASNAIQTSVPSPEALRSERLTAATIIEVSASKITLFYKEELQPSPTNLDGTPWSPKTKLLWWEFSPIKAKPHSLVNLFLLLVIGAACPVFLSYVLNKMLKTRKEAKAVLGPNANCSIKRSHIYRLVAALIALVLFSVTSITTMVIDGAIRGHLHLNLLVQPTPRELALRYTCSCCTGLVLFTLYMTGDELRQTLFEFLRHCARKNARLPCRCRRCVKGESLYSSQIDPITTLPIGATVGEGGSSSDEGDDDAAFRGEEDDKEVMDFFSALRGSSRAPPPPSRVKLQSRQRTASIESVLQDTLIPSPSSPQPESTSSMTCIESVHSIHLPYTLSCPESPV